MNESNNQSNPDGGAEFPRPLPVLRALIDGVDREILQMLSRRYGLVGEIAAYKRDHRPADTEGNHIIESLRIPTIQSNRRRRIYI